MYTNAKTEINTHKIKAKPIGLKPMALRSFIEMVVPTKNKVNTSNRLEIKTIVLEATAGIRW